MIRQFAVPYSDENLQGAPYASDWGSFRGTYWIPTLVSVLEGKWNMHGKLEHEMLDSKREIILDPKRPFGEQMRGAHYVIIGGPVREDPADLLGEPQVGYPIVGDSFGEKVLRFIDERYCHILHRLANVAFTRGEDTIDLVVNVKCNDDPELDICGGQLSFQGYTAEVIAARSSDVKWLYEVKDEQIRKIIDLLREMS